jgi:glycosyltransferase involved in cell wall biosynthesis
VNATGTNPPPEPVVPGPCVPERSVPEISVIVPVLDEEKSLEEFHERLSRSIPRGAEIIFVDDGSTDGTPSVLEKLRARDPRVRVLCFRRNFGKSMALAAGFRHARGRRIATIDADLQEDPAEIPRLAAKLDEGFDLVGGWRRKRKDPGGKVLGSRAFNSLVSFLGGVRFKDINCGLKVFRREVLEDLALAGGFHRFIPLLAHWKGYRVVEVEVSHAPRRHGKSHYGRDRISRGLLDLVAIMFLVRYEGRPSRYFALLGILMGLGGIAISAYLAGLRLLTGSIQSKFPLLSLGLVLLVVGVQLFSLGLFGELLAHHFRSRRPFEPASWETGERSGLEGPAGGSGESAPPGGAP